MYGVVKGPEFDSLMGEQRITLALRTDSIIHLTRSGTTLQGNYEAEGDLGSYSRPQTNKVVIYYIVASCRPYVTSLDLAGPGLHEA